MRRHVEREMGAVIDQTEKNDLPLGLLLLDLAVPGAEQHRNCFRAQNYCLRLAGFDLEDETLRAPDRYEKALAIQQPGANPFALAAAQPCPFETGMRIEIRGSHLRR